nr:hypothetical protein [Streptomyces sp. CC210A]
MNIRSLTRGDGVVIGAAVVLFIASFLSLYSYECQAGLPCVKANAWDNLGLVMSMNIAGIVGAALIVVSRAMPGRKVVNLDLGQFGVALTVFALWTAFWTILDAPSAGAGLILGLLASIALAGGAVASPMVGALKAPLVSATPKPQGAAATPPPYGGQPGAPAAGGYGYPGGAAQPYPGAGAPAADTATPAGRPPRTRPRRAPPGRSRAGRGRAGARSGRRLRPVLVRRAGGAPAVRGGRLGHAGRGPRPGHLVPGGRAAGRSPGRPDAGRPPRRPPGHHGHPARLTPRRRAHGVRARPPGR